MLLCALMLSLAMFAAQNSPGPARQHVRRGYTLAQSGDVKAAEAELREAVKLAPDDPLALAVLGMVLSQQRKLEEANTFFARALELDASDAGTRYNLAANQVAMGRLDEARLNLTLILKQKADHREAASLLDLIRARTGYEHALSRYRAGDYAGARALLEQMIVGGSTGPKVYTLLAWSHHRQKRPNDALAAMRQAIELAPGDASLYSNAAQILIEIGDLKAAKATVSKALELAPDNVQALKVKGRLALEHGDLKQALGTFQRAVKLDPSDAEAVQWLGTAQRALFQYADANSTFETGIARFPSFAPLYEAYAKLLVDSGGAIRASSLLEKALAIDPSLPEAHSALGKLLLDRGKTAEALRHLEAAAKLDPMNNATHLSLADAYRMAGRTADQARELRAYRDLDQRKGLEH